jgi:arginine decarboxylase
MEPFIPEHVFLTKGVGRYREKVTSFESALRDARIASFNPVRVSSIFPPGCKIVPREIGLAQLRSGGLVFCVMAENSTNEPHRLISASVGSAIPRDRKRYGYFSEHHSHGQTDQETGDYAEDLAAQMLATTIGVLFDTNLDHDARKEQFKMGGLIVSTTNTTQSAIGDKHGLWTAVMAAAVFVE